MSKHITKIVLTGGPAAGKTTLISRILKEFNQDDGWRVITIPETATDLISGFGIAPIPNCMTMENFQYYVIADQLHKEKLALKAAQEVPQENILIVYDRAIFDDKAYVSDEDFRTILASFGKTEEEVLSGYDAVIHLVTSARGAEYAFKNGNEARQESTAEFACEMDDRTWRAWSGHSAHYRISNSENFEEKISRAIAQIYRILGQGEPEVGKRKYLVEMPDCEKLVAEHNAVALEMMQTYLLSNDKSVQRRIRQQENAGGYLYFYTEKKTMDDGISWVTERPLSEKEYIRYLMEADLSLHSVRKTKYRFNCEGHRMELDVYPFCAEKAVLFVYGPDEAKLPEELKLIADVTGNPDFKNRTLASKQRL